MKSTYVDMNMSYYSQGRELNSISLNHIQFMTIFFHLLLVACIVFDSLNQFFDSTINEIQLFISTDYIDVSLA